MLTLWGEGNELLEFLPGSEPVIPDVTIPVTFTQVIIEYQGKYLILYNPERGQWELPGGGLEPDETIDDCAVRELLEETGQVAQKLTCCGIFKVRLKSDNRLEYGVLYKGTLDEVRPFEGNAESERIFFWNLTDSLDAKMSALGRTLIEFR